MKHGFFFWYWTGLVLYFAVGEAVAVGREMFYHKDDAWTLTHFLASTVPMSLRIPLLAWVVYHFVYVHING